MFAEFPDGDLYVIFEEGDLESLGSSGSLIGELRGSHSSICDGGVLFRYKEDMVATRPGVAVYDGEDADHALEVVVDDSIYSALEDGEVYNNGIDDYQEISGDAEVMFFPEGEEEINDISKALN